jgi:hypothetical protein
VCDFSSMEFLTLSYVNRRCKYPII